MRPRTLGIVALVLAAVVAAIVLSGTKDKTAARAAPALPTSVLYPPRVSLASLAGRPAVVNFWASWCGPCRKEAPELKRLDRQLGGRARLVGVDWSDNAASARAFIRKAGWTYPNLRDGGGAVGNRYGLRGLPTTFILDGRGRIVRQMTGPQTVASVLDGLRAAT